METPNDSELYRLLKDLKHEQKTGFDIIYAKQDKTNGRISRLEKWQSFVMGAIAALAALSIPQRIIELIFK